MGSLAVILLESVPASLRGELTRWMLEVKAGVFIGRLSASVREKLWARTIVQIKAGSAVLIQVKDNEQHFEINMAGDCDRAVVDYDGLQLIRVPVRSKRKKSIESRAGAAIEDVAKTTRAGKRAAKSSKPSFQPGFTADGFPLGFIERHFQCMFTDGRFSITSGSRSTYDEYDDTSAWNGDMFVDVARALEILASLLRDSNWLANAHEFSGKTISAIDIETTDYMPKAREGFVNIVGVASIDLHDTTSPRDLALDFYQAFNMHRKKELAHHLLTLSWKHVQDSDVLLVFNKDFDIAIIKKIMKDHGLDLPFPPLIVDLNKEFPSLAALEIELETRTGFKRMLTRKGEYSKYYAAFKGAGKGGTKKAIEPIGIYNAIDVLTPLIYYLLTR